MNTQYIQYIKIHTKTDDTWRDNLIEPIYDDIEENYTEYIDNSDETNINRFDEFGNKYYH